MSIPINAPMVGKIVSIGVKAGDKVKKNDVAGIMEAMKMHVKIFAPKDGIVKEIHVYNHFFPGTKRHESISFRFPLETRSTLILRL